MALFRKKKKEQTAEQSTPTEQEDVRPKFRIEYHSLVELSSDSLFYVSSFIEIIGQGFGFGVVTHQILKKPPMLGLFGNIKTFRV